MNKYKIGDKVKLISKNNNTALDIGDIGIIFKADNINNRYKVNTDMHTNDNWCLLSDLELITKEKII